MKPVYILGIVAALIAGFFFGTHYTRLQAQAPLRNLEAARMCAEQALKSFKEEGYDPERRFSNDYINHYSVKRSKCFVLFRTVSSGQRETDPTQAYNERTEELIDPFEGTHYGRISDSRSFEKEKLVQDHVECTMSPLGQATSNCQTWDEWERFKKQYMED